MMRHSCEMADWMNKVSMDAHKQRYIVQGDGNQSHHDHELVVTETTVSAIEGNDGYVTTMRLHQQKQQVAYQVYM